MVSMDGPTGWEGGRSAVEDEPLDSSPIFIKECVPSSRWPKTMCRVVENMRDYGVVAARIKTLPIGERETELPLWGV